MSHRRIVARLRLHGLQATAGAVAALAAAIERASDATLLDRALATLDLQTLHDSCLDKETMERAIAGADEGTRTGNGAALQVLSVAHVPKWRFDGHLKAFRRDVGEKDGVFGDVEARKGLFHERFAWVRQRVARNPLFAAPVLPTDVMRRQYHRLTPIHALRGAVGVVSTVLGVLTRPDESALWLEDDTDSVRLDVSQAQRTPGMFTENCVVIARGVLDNDVFRVSELGMPPAESRADTLAHVSAVGTTSAAPNFFGGRVPTSEEAVVDENVFVAVLSDVRLHEPVVMEKLLALFDGFIASDSIPVAFILMGNFCAPDRDDAVLLLADALDALGNHLLDRPALLAASHIVFVPGPIDPGGTSVRALPNPPLPRVATRRITHRSALRDHVTFASNPCRLRIGNHEMILFREDMAEKMRRHCILPPKDDAHINTLTDHLVKTILDQSHLCPLPLSARPIVWDYDHALRVYPVPDALILADRFAQFETSVAVEGCHTINPGSFPIDFSFVTYTPATGACDFCVVRARDDAEEEEGEAEVAEEDGQHQDASDDGRISIDEEEINRMIDASVSDEEDEDEDEHARHVRLDDLDEEDVHSDVSGTESSQLESQIPSNAMKRARMDLDENADENVEENNDNSMSQ